MFKPALNSPATAVVITGGASGIGRASAETLAAVGRPVAIWDLNADKAQAVATELSERYGVSCVGIGADMSDPAAIAPALEQTRAKLPAIGGLVHAAGMVGAVPVDEITAASWDAVLDLNLRPLPLLIRALLKDLRAHPGSAIVAIASINATLGNGMIPAYSASKSGVIGLVRSLGDSLGAAGIRINAISPGRIHTPMLAPALEAHPGMFERGIQLGRIGQPEEVGRLVRFLLSDEASYITSTELVIDGGTIPCDR